MKKLKYFLMSIKSEYQMRAYYKTVRGEERFSYCFLPQVLTLIVCLMVGTYCVFYIIDIIKQLNNF